MTEANAAGTTYDGATPLLSASTPVTTGAHSVYFSIFDQGDRISDSAVFLDRLRLSSVAAGSCTEGATILTAAKTADAPSTDGGGSNGYTITIANPHTEAFEIDALVDDLPDGFTYTPGSTTGATTANPTVTGQRLRWAGPFTLPAGGTLTLHFGVTVADEPGTYLNEASAESDDVSITPTGPTAPIVVTPAISVDDVTVTEGNTGTTDATFTVTLSGPSTEPVTVDYATEDVTATGAFAARRRTDDGIRPARRRGADARRRAVPLLGPERLQPELGRALRVRDVGRGARGLARPRSRAAGGASCGHGSSRISRRRAASATGPPSTGRWRR